MVDKKEVKKVEVKESDEKKEFRVLLKKYAEQNPLKWADKKEALEAKLNAMK